MSIIAPIVNFLIDLLVEMITFITNLLPETPFQFEPIQWGTFGQMIGLVFPVSQMATHFTLILTAMGLYYAVRWVLRLIRMIQ